MKRKRLIAALAAVCILTLTFFGVVLCERVERRRIFRPAGGEAPPPAPDQIPPVQEWSNVFLRATGDDLVELLDAIETAHADLYARWSLAWLHTRALVEEDDRARAGAQLSPFLKPGHPWRDRALYHRASMSAGPEASRDRRALIAEHRDSVYFDTAIEEEVEFLAAEGDTEGLLELERQIAPAIPTARRRDLSARVVEALAGAKRISEARDRGMRLLKASTIDDAAARVARAFSSEGITDGATMDELMLLADAYQNQREYEPAVSLMRRVLQARYDDERQFALGRALFGQEDFAGAEAAYLRGAAATKDPQWKATFFFHASRATQLRGNDGAAERLMTSAIAVKGTFPPTKAALTQRLRTRLHLRRPAEAAADLAMLRRIAGNEGAYLDGALAYAVAMIAAGNSDAALRTLDSIPPRLANDHDDAELAYWRGRALERSNQAAALESYLVTLRSGSGTYAPFARQRVESSALASARSSALRSRDHEVARQIAAGKIDLARKLQTDRLLLTPDDRAPQIEKLATMYRELPQYRFALELTPHPLPRFPDVDHGDADALLMAMGLYDEAVPAIEKRWSLQPERNALTRSYALHLAGASGESIYAIEVMMRSVPADFQFQLLPPLVRQLLYPRYFFRFIEEDSLHHNADPLLVLSLMREESRFDPRAKSQAAARGLLQFLITTAREIGQALGLVELTPEDLYDPRIIIRLGAKYVGELSSQFDGNRYRVVAAYNAGPRQVALWTRLQAAPGDDYFVSAINFDETKGYVRKVMGSYERYRGE